MAAGVRAGVARAAVTGSLSQAAVAAADPGAQRHLVVVVVDVTAVEIASMAQGERMT